MIMTDQEDKESGRRQAVSEEVLNRMQAVVLLAAFCLVSHSTALTIPISVGNKWLYSYCDSSVESSSNAISVSFSDSVRAGTLSLTIQTTALKLDSLFFSILYVDTGIQALSHRYLGEMDTTRSSSAYGTHTLGSYLKVDTCIYSKNSEGKWVLANDRRLSIALQPDSAFSTTTPPAYFSRKTSSAVIYAGSTLAEGVIVTVDSQYLDRATMTGYGFHDSTVWAESIGLAWNISTDGSGVGTPEGGSLGIFHCSRYVLISFSITIAIRNNVISRGPRSACSMPRKSILVSPAQAGAHGLSVYSIAGRQLSNRVGRQVVIVDP